MKALVTFLLLSFACCIYGQPDSMSDECAIESVIQAEVDAYLKHDFENWSQQWVRNEQSRHYYTTRNYHLGLEGWTKMEERFKKEFAAEQQEGFFIEKYDFDIEVHGGIALVSFKEKYTSVRENTSKVWYAKNNAILSKIDGKWKIQSFNIVNQTAFEPSEYDVMANLNSAGNMLLELKKEEDAIKVFELCTELNPRSCREYNRLGEVYLNMGKKDLAIEYFKKCLILEPENDHASEVIVELEELF